MTKAMAAMSNAMVLSEIHPDRVIQPEFHPLNQILRGYGDQLDDSHKLAIRNHFKNEIGLAHDIAGALGKTLIVRDHSHVDFAWQQQTRSLLIEQLSEHFEITPIVTIRDPREVWLSVKREGWFDGTPDELCRAHCNLLSAFPDAAVFRYEDFTAQPNETVKSMCEAAGLKFEADFHSRLDDITHLTGDSGRKSSVIEPRPAKPLPASDKALFDTSPAFAELNDIIDGFGGTKYV